MAKALPVLNLPRLRFSISTICACERVRSCGSDKVTRTKPVLVAPAGATNTGFVRVTLSEPHERTRSQAQIVEMVNRNLGKFSTGRAFAIQDQTIQVNRRGGLPVQFVIQNNDFNKIREALPQFLEAANKNPVFQGVDVDLKFNKPEVNL